MANNFIEVARVVGTNAHTGNSFICMLSIEKSSKVFYIITGSWKALERGNGICKCLHMSATNANDIADAYVYYASTICSLDNTIFDDLDDKDVYTTGDTQTRTYFTRKQFMDHLYKQADDHRSLFEEVQSYISNNAEVVSQ
jgi:hypothetical protein